MTQALILFVVPALLALAAGWDLASYTIPNALSAALILAFVVFAVAAHMSFSVASSHGAALLVGLGCGFLMFALGAVGGGDAKLFAAATLWIGFGNFLDFALIASVFGGVLALGVLSLRRWPLPASLMGQGWIQRLHEKTSGIPYGVALAAGALVVLPHTDVFRIAFA